MAKQVIGLAMGAAMALIGSTSSSNAEDMVGRYQCTIVGPSVAEPLGDRSDHSIQSVQYSCVGVDGQLKGAALTGNAVVEWQGAKSTFLAASTTHRTPAGLVVGQLIEGNGSLAIEEGKVLGNDAAGRATFK